MASQVVLNLSPEQQLHLLTGTGILARRVHVDPATGVATPLERSCARCLLSDDLPGVSLHPSGLCNHCLQYEQQVLSGAYSETRALELIHALRGSGTPDCVLAYSGGKDSAAALLVARQRYGLHPVAVLVDNGFIPDQVKEAAREFCESLDTRLIIRPIEIARQTAESLRTGSNVVPCQFCIRNVFAVMAQVCREHGLRLVLGGHRFPPLSFRLDQSTHRPEDADICCVSPLLSLRIPEREQIRLISAAGWKPVSIAGNTSNCRLIGYIEEHFFDRHGYNPHVYEVSKEIRAGFYSRADGLAKIERPHLAPDHRLEVETKLGWTGPGANGIPAPHQGA